MLSSIGNRLRSFLNLDEAKDQPKRGKKRKLVRDPSDVEVDLLQTPKRSKSDRVFQTLRYPVSKIAEWIVKKKISFQDRYHVGAAVDNDDSSLEENKHLPHRPSDPVAVSMQGRTRNGKGDEDTYIAPPPVHSHVSGPRPIPYDRTPGMAHISMGPPTVTSTPGMPMDGTPYVTASREIHRGTFIASSQPSVLVGSYPGAGIAYPGLGPPRPGQMIRPVTSNQNAAFKQEPEHKTVFEKMYGRKPGQSPNNFIVRRGVGKSPGLKGNTVRQSIDMEEKERYRQLLQQFTSTPVGSESFVTRSSSLVNLSVAHFPNQTVLGSSVPKKEAFVQEKLPRQVSHQKVVPTKVVPVPDNQKVVPESKSVVPESNKLSNKSDVSKSKTVQFASTLSPSIFSPEMSPAVNNKGMKSRQMLSPEMTPRGRFSQQVQTPPQPNFEDETPKIVKIEPPKYSPSNFEEKFRSSPYFDESWIKDMKDKFQSSTRARRRQIEEEEMKTKLYRERRILQEKALEDQIREHMTIAEKVPAVLEDEYESEEEEEELPELTSDQENMVNDALTPYPEGQTLVEGFNLELKRRDFSTVAGLNWLNDEIINFYLSLVVERGDQSDYGKVHAFNTFFYPKLMSGGHSSLRRWTRKVDIFAKDFILIPVHLGMHWCMCIVNFRDKKILYFDSMGGRNHQCLKGVREYLKAESLDKKKQAYDMSGWTEENVQNIPQQMNGSDCGMFACKYAEYITRGAELTFSQNDMPYFRRRMVYELLTKKLM